MRRSESERFWQKVDLNGTGGCWLWLGNKVSLGYGQFSIGTRKVFAHRWAYEKLVGPIPEGLTIDHLCKVRNCVNPDHLEAVTLTVNILRGDGWGGINARKTHCIHGHPFSVENTRVRPDGSRQCRTCARRDQRAFLERKRATVR